MKKRMRKLLISSLTLAMLLVNSLNVFAAETSEDQTTNVYVPLGVTSEHTMDVESIPAETAEAVLNVTFATVKGEYVGSTTVKESAAEGEGVLKTFELGTDFQLPEGYQLVSCVLQIQSRLRLQIQNQLQIQSRLQLQIQSRLQIKLHL